EPCNKRALQIHGEAADEVLEKRFADGIRDDHHGEERYERSKDKAVDENDHPSLFEVGKFGMFDFAIDLGKRFLAAHRQHGMPEGNEHRDDTELGKNGMCQPTEGAVTESQVTRGRKWRESGMANEQGVNAPGDEDDHHHGDQLHDLKG